MSNAIFPTSIKYAVNVKKSPEFATLVQRSASLREVRASLTAYPIWNFSLSFELLRQYGSFDELRTIAGFFLQRRGSFDSFLFVDPADNRVTDEQIGSTNGINTQFQLTREFGGFVEPVENPKTITSVKVGGVVQVGNYSVGPTGIITFASAPPAGLLTWTGSYYMRCRFADDVADFNQFAKDLYEFKKVELIGAPGNKV